MPLLHLLILALVQGITEFLPISSSGHLILVPQLTGWEDQGVLIDIAVHVGTLAAVLLYFRRDTAGLTLAALGSLGVRPARRAVADTIYLRLFWSLVIATLPVVMAGLALSAAGLTEAMRSVEVVAVAGIVFAIVLYVADQRGPRRHHVGDVKLKAALQIGLAQVLALIPGTSRAGVTMTAARALGFKRPDAARFSMLLAIPTIIAGGTLAGMELAQEGADGRWRDAAIGAALAFATALAAIHFLMQWLQRASMTIFVVYRIVLGLGLLAWAFL